MLWARDKVGRSLPVSVTLWSPKQGLPEPKVFTNETEKDLLLRQVIHHQNISDVSEEKSKSAPKRAPGGRLCPHAEGKGFPQAVVKLLAPMDVLRHYKEVHCFPSVPAFLLCGGSCYCSF